MGHGIAQVCAQSGFYVDLSDVKDELLESALLKIRKSIQGSVERGRITQEEAEAALGRISTSTSLKETTGEADLVIEAIIENMEIKKETFRQLDEIYPERTIFASNTSYQSITELATVTERQDKFLGMHWFNPPQIMRGIEVVRTEKTERMWFSRVHRTE